MHVKVSTDYCFYKVFVKFFFIFKRISVIRCQIIINLKVTHRKIVKNFTPTFAYVSLIYISKTIFN